MAVILNGTNQGIDLGTPSQLDIRQRPLGFYAEFMTSTVAVQWIFAHARSGSQNEYRMNIHSDDSGRLDAFWFWTGTNPAANARVFTGGLVDGNWHRALCVVRPDGTIVLYADGSQVNSLATSGTTTLNLNNISSIGYEPVGSQFWFNGQIANVAAWDVELSQQDAEALTAGTLSPGSLQTGLRAYWPLDYDARDLGPHGLHGTLVGSPQFTLGPPRWFRSDGVALRPHLKTPAGLVGLE